MSWLPAWVIGGVLGGLFAWLATLFYVQQRHVIRQRGLETRAASAESAAALLREQAQQAAADFERLRADLATERAYRVSAETKLDASEQHLDQQRHSLAEAQARLVDTFKALSTDALKSNNQAFLELARQSLDHMLTEAKGELGQRQEAIKGLVRPLEEVLRTYQTHVQELERAREHAYGKLTQQLESMAKAEEQIQRETQHLVSALRQPQIRGRWGEVTLRRVVELAGMSEHCDFEEQVSMTDEDRRLRPDMVIFLPGDRRIVVDAKTSMEAYFRAIEMTSDEERDAALRQHAAHIKTHMEQLASKEYWASLASAPAMVVMFVPSEAFFITALRFERSLIEDAMERRVLIATPATLFAYLTSIAHGWRQEQLAKHAALVADLGREAYDRLVKFLEHVGNVRRDLDRSVSSFNEMVGSLEHRLLPGLRKFRELGATAEAELPVIETIEQAPKRLTVQEPVMLTETTEAT